MANNKQFVVIGLGRFGESVAKTLYSLGHDVLAIDMDEDSVQEISDSVTHAVQMDATDESALKTLGLRNFDVAVVTIGSNIQASVMITLLVKELGVKKENIILLPRINNSEVTSFNLMEKTALDFERKFDNVTHVAHTYKYDWHLQHLKNGSTIQSLYNSGKIKHALYFIKPRYEKDLPISEKIIYKSETTMEKQRIKKACMAYKIIDEKSKREGIGYKSDHKSFEDLMIKNRSILHTPNV